MKIEVSKLRVLACLLVVLVCGLPAFAVAPAPPAYQGNATAAEISQPQVGSRLQLSNLDCSHLVHAIYQSVGLDYQYTTSRVLYRGTNKFRRVLRPNPGDLIAWRGHVGIVVDPARHIFLSALNTGVKVSSYLSAYWKHRGSARFLRYAFPCENAAALARVEDAASVALAATRSHDPIAGGKRG